jgi:pseudouridylate synthase
MDYPMNKDCAMDMINLVEENGATPAAIAIIGGKIKIGLSEEEVEYLAKVGRKARKCSRRDLAYCLSKKMDGSTTVAGTMYLANLAGIKIFATGGLGGVHRGAEETFDISADLTELSKTPVCVVSAGVKAILDIPKTLEYLETMGVPVTAIGQDNFPNFYTSNSGQKAPFRANDHKECAAMIEA